jgi:hypothetical protein
MRGRDKVFLFVMWGGLLAGLVWALCTQSRWVQENKPIQVQRPPNGPTESEQAPAPTGMRAHLSGRGLAVSADSRQSVNTDMSTSRCFFAFSFRTSGARAGGN